jgi:polyhydroxybutyrate depolymerase
MFMIRLVRRLSGEGTLFRRNRLLFIGLAILYTFALFWLLVSKSGLSLTTTDVTQARAGDTLIPLSAKSAGCGKPSPVAPGTSVNQTILSGGITRSYLLHIPRSYLDTTSQALVLDFHGHGSSATNQEYLTGFSTLADAHDVIVAYPQGAVGPDHHTGWDTGPRRNPGTNDVLFVSDLLRHLQSTWCINPHRVYAVGFSNGGGMTNVLACKLAGRIAAFASVSGAYPTVPGGCHPARPVPFIELHGTGDSVVPYGGSLLKGYPPVAFWLGQWAQRDGCATNPVIFFNEGNVIGEKWTGCRDHVEIVHYQIGGMGHRWPRHIIIRYQDRVTSLSPTNLIWAFFQDNPLPSGTSRI